MGGSGGAEFSPCGRYRYRLWRYLDRLDGNGLRVGFVMCNPSTADADTDDPTIRRCLGFAQTWGYDRLEVANLFAWRSTKPSVLLTVDDPVGQRADAELRAMARFCHVVIAAWGVPPAVRLRPRAAEVEALFLDAGKPLHALAVTREGFPMHPLYIKASTRPRALTTLREELLQAHETTL